MQRAAYALVAVAAIAIGVTALTTLGPRFGIGPSPTPTPAIHESSPSPVSVDQSPPPLDATFSSIVHGMSMDYPSGWQIRRATEPWSGGELNFDSPAADIIFDPTLGDRLYFALASKPLGAAEWRLPDFCVPGETRGITGGTVHVDGIPALDHHSCGSASIEVETATRAYVIMLVVANEPGLRQSYNGYFDDALTTIQLQPEEAR